MASSYPFRSALITGASSGIGEAMAELLGQAGIPQVVVARRVDRLEELAARHSGIEVLAADLTTAEGLDVVVRRVADEEHPIDLVVNNAGFGPSGEFFELDGERLGNEIGFEGAAVAPVNPAATGALGA